MARPVAILKALALTGLHGLAISHRIAQITNGTFGALGGLTGQCLILPSCRPPIAPIGRDGAPRNGPIMLNLKAPTPEKPNPLSLFQS